jgi:hypothetical protein
MTDKAEVTLEDAVASDFPEVKQTRELSTIDFPYNSLDDVIVVAKAVHKLGGNECRIETLAGELGHETTKSGGFRQKLASAGVFGLMSNSAGHVRLTPLGARIVDSDQERAAKVEAFLKVPLYAAIYEEFKAGALPPSAGLETKMVALGVATKQKDKARQVFQRSAKEAGFFAYGSTKLVYPAISKNDGKNGNTVQEKPKGDKPGNGGGDGGDGGDDDNNQSLIDGLIKVLPKAGSPWTLEAQKKWLQTAAANFAYAYNGTDEVRSIKVSIEND